MSLETLINGRIGRDSPDERNRPHLVKFFGAVTIALSREVMVIAVSETHG
jgi:hypothetical protein